MGDEPGGNNRLVPCHILLIQQFQKMLSLFVFIHAAVNDNEAAIDQANYVQHAAIIGIVHEASLGEQRRTKRR